MGMKICGPKLSACCSVISTWGVIMLVLMGVFFRVNSVALFEDLTLESNKTLTRAELEEAYTEVSNNCFIAAGLYVLWLFFSVWQMHVNSKEQYNVS
ncbi:ribonuclease kappa-like [Acanthaster planci]|uniref:Ribonuclease kappa-like n=1 Tax=Acanthaster planci TaxID=133434 RepID=A0A8B7YVJ0_ACAPL|nr:ribonuclease kappa-like [Acanthaster planci]